MRELLEDPRVLRPVEREFLQRKLRGTQLMGWQDRKAIADDQLALLEAIEIRDRQLELADKMCSELVHVATHGDALDIWGYVHPSYKAYVEARA